MHRQPDRLGLNCKVAGFCALILAMSDNAAVAGIMLAVAVTLCEFGFWRERRDA